MMRRLSVSVGAAVASMLVTGPGPSGSEESPPASSVPIEADSSTLWLECPSVHLVGLPVGWNDELLPTETGFRFETPLGSVEFVMDADHGPSSGMGRKVDGYSAYVSTDSDPITVHVLVNRDDCGHIDIAFSGWDDSQIELVLSGVEFGDSRLTDVDAGVRVLDEDGVVIPQLFGRHFGELVDLDPFVAAVSALYGVPDVDTGWLAMPDEWACTYAGQYRNLVWGDLLVVFERSDRDERMVGWWIGTDRHLLAPISVGSDPPIRSLGIDSDVGLRVGADPAVVDGLPGSGLRPDGKITLLGGGTHLAITTADGAVTGFGTGPLDCIGDA